MSQGKENTEEPVNPKDVVMLKLVNLKNKEILDKMWELHKIEENSIILRVKNWI